MNPPEFLTAQLIVSLATIFIVLPVILLTVAYLIYLERKISAYIQDRIGPNRVGPLGLLQPIADGLKFLLKEDFCPRGADRILFTLAPAAILIPALVGFAVIPWGGVWNCPDIYIPILGWTIEGGPVHVAGAYVNIGVIYLIAVASVGTYGVVLGGWASNNKYSFLGGLRASAQMLSYEIPLVLALLAVVLLVGAVIPHQIINYQLENGWLIFSQPLAAILFFVCILAEANRLPFDNAEAESELVGGYHTEYSSMRFAMFFLGEYGHMITSSAFFTLLFLGGYHLPLIPALSPEATGFLAVLAKFAVYFLKVLLLVCFMMLIRWSLPRIRFDQVMQAAWQAAIPLSLAIVILTSVMVYLRWTGPVPMFLANAALVAACLALQPVLPVAVSNKRVRLAGSRFAPLLGDEEVVTEPTHPAAREDRPVEGTRPVAASR